MMNSLHFTLSVFLKFVSHAITTSNAQLISSSSSWSTSSRRCMSSREIIHLPKVWKSSSSPLSLRRSEVVKTHTKAQILLLERGHVLGTFSCKVARLPTQMTDSRWAIEGTKTPWRSKSRSTSPHWSLNYLLYNRLLSLTVSQNWVNQPFVIIIQTSITSKKFFEVLQCCIMGLAPEAITKRRDS